MTPAAFTERLRQACGDNLHAVVLFGSAAAGDHLGKRSDYNILVVLNRLGVAELKTMAPAVRAWARRGNPPPLCFTHEGLQRTAATFPLELSDIKEAYRILAGEDLVRGLRVAPDHLRHQVDYELGGKLLQLRSQFVLNAGRPRQLTRVMVRSISSILVLCRGVLRLHQPTVPAAKLEALRLLAARLNADFSPLETIARLKAGARTPGLSPERLFADYLSAIKVLAAAVDGSPSARREP